MVTKISGIINKSRQVVFIFNLDPQAYRTIKHSGRKPQLAKATHIQLLQYAKTGDYSANEKMQTLNLPIKKKRVQAILNAEELLQYRSVRKCPYLSPPHIERSLEWAVKHVSTVMPSWDRVVL